MRAWVGVAAAAALIGTPALGAAEAARETLQEKANGEFVAKHYPPGALKRGEQGRVAFRLTIEPDGSLGACDVTESSGFAALDRETCGFLVEYARVQPVRGEDGRRIRASRSGFIVWRLPAGVASATKVAAGTMAKPERMICKRAQAPGSWIVKKTQCMTPSDWKKQEQAVRSEVQRAQEVRPCGDHGCQ